MRPYLKKIKQKKLGSLDQLAECLLSKSKAPSLKTQYLEKKNKKDKRKTSPGH
jgi:hypothetical protein